MRARYDERHVGCAGVGTTRMDMATGDWGEQELAATDRGGLGVQVWIRERVCKWTEMFSESRRSKPEMAETRALCPSRFRSETIAAGGALVRRNMDGMRMALGETWIGWGYRGIRGVRRRAGRGFSRSNSRGKSASS
ncbi:hypothetical protein FRC12_024949 [Ceratobasidium sp. 428]|nr:hypothetical protein FRC12_024949 [Ceratobasidium sp. 428]